MGKDALFKVNMLVPSCTGTFQEGGRTKFGTYTIPLLKTGLSYDTLIAMLNSGIKKVLLCFIIS